MHVEYSVLHCTCKCWRMGWMYIPTIRYEWSAFHVGKWDWAHLLIQLENITWWGNIEAVRIKRIFGIKFGNRQTWCIWNFPAVQLSGVAPTLPLTYYMPTDLSFCTRSSCLDTSSSLPSSTTGGQMAWGVRVDGGVWYKHNNIDPQTLTSRWLSRALLTSFSFLRNVESTNTHNTAYYEYFYEHIVLIGITTC